MSVTEVLDGLGSWSVKLDATCPDEVISQLGFLGHVVIVRGHVDVTATSSSLLAAARYVGVVRDRSKDRRTLEGDGMLFWLGDEDDKGKVLETAVNLSAASLSTAVNAVLPPAVHTGTINTAAGTYTGKHQYETPRAALDTITQAFGVEYRVNGTATIDVGTQAQLYRTSPVVIIAAKNAGQDMDLTSLGASFDVDETVRDYTGRVLLLGSSFDDGTTTVFATGSADAPSLPFLDPWGNAFRPTRMISESGTTSGSVTARAQLQLNRFNRTATALKVTATDYQIGGGQFQVGDNAYVYDPANGIFDPARSIDFRGELIHPDVVRISGATWPVTEDHTVAFRTNAGAWVDLTPWVVWETGGGEITVGDLPKSLTSGGGNPVQDRADSLPDATIPTAPTGLTLTTSAEVDPRGQNAASVFASWTAPTVNTDGTVITDLANYVVQYRNTFRAPQWLSTSTVATSIVLPATIDLDFDVRVAAQDRSGHVGAFTAVQTIHASVDTTGPAAPSDPVVTSYIGILRIFWDGLTNVGGAMPADFNRVDVHVSATSGFTPSAATLTDSLSTKGYAGAIATPYGSLRYVKFIAYDNAGNASAASGQTSGSTVQAADGDIQTLNVGKLVAGTMSADVTISGRFATASTGARREMNAIGWQAWDASNNLIVNLDGVNNLLTGIFRTGIAPNRRIEIGTGGNVGYIRFIAPDGTEAWVGAFTSLSGVPGQEAVNLGIPQSGVSDAWNSFQVVENQNAFVTSCSIGLRYGGGTGFTGPSQQLDISYYPTRGTPTTSPTGARVRYSVDETNGHIFRTGVTSTSRMQISPTQFLLWDSAGDARIQITDSSTVLKDGTAGRNRYQFDTGNTSWQYADDHIFYSVTTPSSAGGWADIIAGQSIGGSGGYQDSAALGLVCRPISGVNYGGQIKYAINNNLTNQGIEARSATDAGYIPVRASSFDVNSSERGKASIRDLAGSATDRLRPVRARVFQRVRGGRGAGVDEVGLIAEEMPAEVVVDGFGDDGPSIALMSLFALLVAAQNESDDRLTALETRGGRP